MTVINYYFLLIFFQIMEKFKLNNGATIVITDCSSKELSVSVTVNVGHVNEPKLGIASLYENVLMKQMSKVQTIYGGTVTSFFTGCAKEEAEVTISKMAQLIKSPYLGKDLIEAAAFDIVEHTRDMAPLVKRQMKLLYKHTAFGTKRVLWDAESYIAALESYGAEDLKEFANKYYTGKNLVVVFAGKHLKSEVLKPLAEKYFGDIPSGERQRVQNSIYTGGYGSIHSNGDYRQIMLGWDVTEIKESSSANVLMSMLAKRLERSFNEKYDPVKKVKVACSTDAQIEVKIAGYYGRRTLRITVTSSQMSTNEMLDIVCQNVCRLQNSEASERRMESSKQWAMSEKLWFFSQPQPAAVETAWQLFGKGEMYDINDRINYIWNVSAHEVKAISRDIFAAPLTMVLYTDEPHYSYKEVQEKLK